LLKERDRVGAVETKLRKMGEKLGFRVYPHRFRRTMATNAIDKGMSLEQVQQLLGHVNMDTTLVYAKVKQSNVKFSHEKYLGG
jgi:site-specific recombinase XerD